MVAYPQAIYPIEFSLKPSSKVRVDTQIQGFFKNRSLQAQGELAQFPFKPFCGLYQEFSFQIKRLNEGLNYSFLRLAFFILSMISSRGDPSPLLASSNPSLIPSSRSLSVKTSR